jgi:hypothetical protein
MKFQWQTENEKKKKKKERKKEKKVWNSILHKALRVRSCNHAQVSPFETICD